MCAYISSQKSLQVTFFGMQFQNVSKKQNIYQHHEASTASGSTEYKNRLIFKMTEGVKTKMFALNAIEMHISFSVNN